jgi:hypothetical protein
MFPKYIKQETIIDYTNFKEINFEKMPIKYRRYALPEFKKAQSIVSNKIRPFVIQYEKKIENTAFDIQYKENRKATLIYRTKTNALYIFFNVVLKMKWKRLVE